MATQRPQKDSSRSAKKAKREERAASGQGQNPKPPDSFLLGARAMSLAAVLGGGYTLARAGWLDSAAEKKPHIAARLVFFMIVQSVGTELFTILMLQVGRRLVGEREHESVDPSPDELATNDPSIPWPSPELLKPELRRFLEKPGQPFFLNHVTGRQRCKDACMRIGMTFGSVLAVWCTCSWMDRRSVASLGLALDSHLPRDAAAGFCVGVGIVAFTFVVELAAGWLHFLESFQVFDTRERFAPCIFWDVVFHLNVSLNEELPVRGWMLHSLADACAAHMSLGPTPAFAAALVAESALFVVMHLASPGGSRPLSMINIFVGGVAGGLNVLFTGGRLGFALGWHFGWNISMGNVFGLSTSGIPISATFLAVAPDPLKQHLHGGVFGPEGGVIAPAAYGLGIGLLALLYGLPSGAPVA